MKALLFALSLFMASSSVYATGTEPSVKKINPTTSNIVWKGHKLVKSHHGNIKFQSGHLEFKDNVLVGGEMIIDMHSLENVDLKGSGMRENLEGHLKSEDFFGVDKYPTAKIKFKRVVTLGEAGKYRVTADVTIKNKTKEIKFDATANNGVANAALKLDRSDFDVRYGSGSFFDNLGDKTIHDDFDLDVTVKY